MFLEICFWKEKSEGGAAQRGARPEGKLQAIRDSNPSDSGEEEYCCSHGCTEILSFRNRISNMYGEMGNTT